MSTDRNEIADRLSKLSPQERADVESLVLEKVFRDASERERARDPERHRLAEEHARDVVAALGPIPPEAAEKVRAAWASVARDLLEGRTS
jgi:hypothetical protein